MKKKLIEISVEEDGTYTFETEVDVFSGGDPLDERTVAGFDKMLGPLIEALFLEYYKNKNMMLSRVIKFLTIADICADGQPYQHIEHLWDMMMFSHLPKYEKKYRKMKESYGFQVKVDEPISWVNPFMLDILGQKKS